MRAIDAAGLVFGAIGAAGAVATVMQWAGIEFDGVAGKIMWLAPLWVPAAMFSSGFAVGWKARDAASRRPTRPEVAYARMVEGFSRDKARAALNAYEADGLIDVGPYRTEVAGSIQARQGVFVMRATEMLGRVVEGDEYGITDGFRAFLGKGRNLEKLKRRAR